MMMLKIERKTFSKRKYHRRIISNRKRTVYITMREDKEKRNR
jgi:hypothetical protein